MYMLKNQLSNFKMKDDESIPEMSIGFKSSSMISSLWERRQVMRTSLTSF
jgi:hypothetical protein